MLAPSRAGVNIYPSIGNVVVQIKIVTNPMNNPPYKFLVSVEDNFQQCKQNLEVTQRTILQDNKLSLSIKTIFSIKNPSQII